MNGSLIKPSLSELFIIYLKIGVQSVGGGYAMLTVLEHLMVEEKKWINHEEFLHAITVGQSAPGVMICNVGGFIAYRLMGFWGLLLAMIGMVLPSFFVVVGFAIFYSTAEKQIWLNKFFQGVGPAVVGALAALTVRVAKRNMKSVKFGLIAIIAFLAVVLYQIHPIAIVLAAVLLGILVAMAQKLERKP